MRNGNVGVWWHSGGWGERQQQQRRRQVFGAAVVQGRLGLLVTKEIWCLIQSDRSLSYDGCDIFEEQRY